MTKKTIAYGITTGVAAAAFALGGAMDLAHGKEIEEGMAHLGYPAYFLTILGVWKLLGAVAITAPGTARLKEWAYAGMAFDLTGAAASHAAVGDGADKVVTPLVILAVVAASYLLRPASRVLGAPMVRVTPAPIEATRLRAA